MTIRAALGLLSLAALAACGSNNGNGDNTVTSGVRAQATPNAVCSEQPGNQICGPSNSSTAPLTGLTPTTTPTATASAPTACRHHKYRQHHHRRCAAAGR